jgi:hypothetical protein
VFVAYTVRAIVALMMEAARTFETFVDFYQTILYNPEDGHLLNGRRENLKSYK